MSKHPGRRGKQLARRLKREEDRKVKAVTEKLDRVVYSWSVTYKEIGVTADGFKIMTTDSSCT